MGVGAATAWNGTCRARRVPHGAHLDLTLCKVTVSKTILLYATFASTRLRCHSLSVIASWDGSQQDGELLSSPSSELVDPFAGVADLFASRLDVVSTSAFRDDPGRILRGARLAAHLNLTAAPQTITLARAAAPFLTDVRTTAPVKS